MSKRLSYGYFDLAMPLDNLGVDDDMVINAGGDFQRHKNIFLISRSNELVYVPFNSTGANQHHWFDLNENIILNQIQWSVRMPEYAKSWIKDFKMIGVKELSDGTDIETLPTLGAIGSTGSPQFRQNTYFPETTILNYFLNIHPASQVLNMQFRTSFVMNLKLTDTDLDNIYRLDLTGNDFEAHHVYISVIYQFSHTLPLIEAT